MRPLDDFPIYVNARTTGLGSLHNNNNNKNAITTCNSAYASVQMYLIVGHKEIIGPQVLLRDAKLEQILDALQLATRRLVSQVVSHKAYGHRAIAIHILDLPAAAHIHVTVVRHLSDNNYDNVPDTPQVHSHKNWRSHRRVPSQRWTNPECCAS